MREWALRLLRTHREKVLYLIVGGWNTVFNYAVFSLCWYLLSPHLYADVVLLISYCIASVNSFLGFRYIVFKPSAHPLVEYLRFQLVYVPILLINMVVLPLLLRHTSFNAYAIQAMFAVFSVIASYLGNKYFTFRKVGQSGAADAAE